MAENLSVKKSSIECVLECPLCLHQLTLPQTLQQCLHSYCKSCLEKEPQKSQDCRQGWLCPMCETFTRCDQVQQNTFIEELQKIHSEPINDGKIKCDQCLDDCGEATWKCAECKIGLCENGKALHFKIPMLRGHQILPLDNEGEKVIDNIVFCNAHENIPAQLNCRNCAQLICYKCKITDHEEHKAETVEQALERIIPVTESSAKQVNENLNIIQAQIKGINTKIEQTRESYASCRLHMDEHLEKVIGRMRAMKAQMEEDVNEQESIALDTLKELKQQLEKQQSQASIICNMTAVVASKTRHTSQLQQLQTGLFEKVKSAGEIKHQRLCFNLSTSQFVEGQRFQEEIDKVYGKLRFDVSEHIINISGENYAKPNQFLCCDFNKLAETQFKKTKEIIVDVDWCKRLSYIDNQVWLPLDSRKKINIYNEDGELNVIDTGDKSITVVKEAYNGDIICAGDDGLFVTDKQLSKWKKLSEGEFSDVVIDNDQFIVLQYDDPPSVHTYSSVNNGEESSWHESHSFMVHQDVAFDCSSNICILDGQYLLLTSTESSSLYKFTCFGEYLHSCKTLPVDPVICGTDRNNNVLIADFTKGTMYLFNPLTEKGIQRKSILSAVQTAETRSVVIDRNNNLWVLSGMNDFKLIRFTSEQ